MAGAELATSATQNAPKRGATRDARAKLPVCVLDDDAAFLAAVLDIVEGLGFPALGTSDPAEALDAVRQRRCRVVLSDVRMPQMDGVALLEQAVKLDPTVDVILMTGYYSMDAAIEAIRRGARDYLTKPFESQRLEKTLEEIAEQRARRQRVQELEETLLEELSLQGIVGQSPAMLEMMELMRKVAPHYGNVLVTGPTGAGKELVGRALHAMSPVGGQRFAVCNCSALVETLLESQLFGHVRGAFTGATESRPGLFEYAGGGTVFLDEVGEMSPGLQAKLLRVIENREIQRVGSPEARRVEVRLVAATNRELRAEVLAGRFREDLFYRLSAMEIRVPPLAERTGDVALLARHFLKKFNQAYSRGIVGFTRRATAQLLRHAWPGNVRELENAVSSACITTAAEMIDIEDLPESLRRAPGAGPTDGCWRPSTLDEVRREHIERVLEMCAGNRLRAAQVLGIGRTSLYRFLKRRQRRSARENGEPAAGASPAASGQGRQEKGPGRFSEGPPR